uniref:Secreted protein n=1 Tax=Gallus gallus TaxID=9031 RepID=A0A8V0YFT9_CHICK
MQPIVVLLAFPALFCCCSKTLAMPVAMLVLSRLELQMAQPSAFFLLYHTRRFNTTLLSEILMLLPGLQALPQLVGQLGQWCQERFGGLARQRGDFC